MREEKFHMVLYKYLHIHSVEGVHLIELVWNGFVFCIYHYTNVLLSLVCTYQVCTYVDDYLITRISRLTFFTIIQSITL